MSKKENALDLAKFVDKGVRVKLSGGREGENCVLLSSSDYLVNACGWIAEHSEMSAGRTLGVTKEAVELLVAVEGVLKGYDPLLNLVLDETKEYIRGAQPSCHVPYDARKCRTSGLHRL